MFLPSIKLMTEAMERAHPWFHVAQLCEFNDSVLYNDFKKSVPLITRIGWMLKKKEFDQISIPCDLKRDALFL